MDYQEVLEEVQVVKVQVPQQDQLVEQEILHQQLRHKVKMELVVLKYQQEEDILLEAAEVQVLQLII
tara:strand:+ start:224 stop:424 length:201 start_codon:yes stop_codon:yes gene_type:complete